jgi:hypothetical protein
VRTESLEGRGRERGGREEGTGKTQFYLQQQKYLPQIIETFKRRRNQNQKNREG